MIEYVPDETFAAIAVVVSCFFYWLLLRPLSAIFTKAGQSGNCAYVPVYNLVIVSRIVRINPWGTLLAFSPAAGFFFLYLMVKVCMAFGKGAAFMVLTLTVPWLSYLILAYGDCRYVYEGGSES